MSPEKIGLGLTVFVAIETNDHSSEWLARFAETVSAMPEVMELYRMAGEVDYQLRVVVADMAAYDQFYKRLIARDAVEERHFALRHGAHQADDGASGARRAGARGEKIRFVGNGPLWLFPTGETK